MLQGMDKFVGLKLTEEAIDMYKNQISGGSKIVIWPDFYSSSVHINMDIHVDSDMRITDFSGSKCYSTSRGLYSRSATVHYRDFTQKDMAYLRKFVKSITEK